MLKGGVPLKGSVKKIKHKKSKAVAAAADSDDEEQHVQQEEQAPAGAQPDTQPGATRKVDPHAINVMSGKSYEQEFDLEQQRMKKPKVKSTPWGSSYRAAPEILHGYTSKVTGKNASERLDMRAATKADKFCK